MKNPQDLPADSEPLRELPEDYVLASYLAGEDDAAAKALVKTWVGGDVRRQKALERLRDGWDGAAREPVQGDLPGFLQTLWRQIEKEEKIATPEGREDSAKYGVAIRPGKGRTLRRWGWSAGIVSAGILAVVLGRIDQPVDAEITRTYTTHPGQQATFTLIDGSRITLAPQSTLRLTRFGRRFRTVELDGEAYFEVPHTPDAPFLVQSGLVTTRVLGTAFLIRHYPGESRVHVAVAEGRVSVTGLAAPASGVSLVAGRVGDISDSTLHVSTAEDISRQASWIRGEFVFRDMPVTEVLATLTRWYGFHFRCADSTLAQQNITAGLSTRSSAAALATLEQVLGVSFAVRGDTILLTPNKGHFDHDRPSGRSHDVWTPRSEVGR